MRLSHIKLVGFKSFVDSTTLLFPSNKVGIVGPNGCGKSNIIDAVRWVMGEISAKKLRGGAMSDVIFNGSSTRQAVDQASIELHFEEVNNEKFPPNSAIFVKRQVSRNGQSAYFLNNVRCRRKDITDLFLGTGLGGDNYAIIEQGMISRLIEAKPEELRIFVEEAAGISKYKERRKETEVHIAQTNENIGKLNEVINELTRQLNKLKKQVKEAERFEKLKELESLSKAKLLAFRWHEFDKAVQSQEQSIAEKSSILENNTTTADSLESTNQQQRKDYAIAQKTLTEVQNRFHILNNEINRLSQTIDHTNERCEQLQWDLEELDSTIEKSERHIDADKQKIARLNISLRESENEKTQLQQLEFQTQSAFQNAETQRQAWQTKWDVFNQRAIVPMQQAEVAKTRITHLEQRIAQNQQHLDKLSREEQGIDIVELEGILKILSIDIEKASTELAEAIQHLDGHQKTALILRNTVQHISAQLIDNQAKKNQWNGRLASLETLQESALGKSDVKLHTWLKNNQLTDIPRLAQFLRVESGWEKAVEIVLGYSLQSLCLENLDSLKALWNKPPQGNVAFFEEGNEEWGVGNRERGIGEEYLVSKVHTSLNIENLFAGIHIADSLEKAYEMRKNLALTESVITPQGIWLGINWLRSFQGNDKEAGILAREKEIADLKVELKKVLENIKQLSNTLEEQQFNLREHEENRDKTQRQVNVIQEKLGQWQSQYGGKKARLEHIKIQLQRITDERVELNTQNNEHNQSLIIIHQDLEKALAVMNQLADEREMLTRERDFRQSTVEKCRREWLSTKENVHRMAMRMETLHSEHTHLSEELSRLTERLERLQDEHTDLKSNLEKHRAPLTDLENELGDYQEERTETEVHLNQAKQAVENLESALSQYEMQRRNLDSQNNELRGTLEQERLRCQANKVHRETLESQLAETPFSPVALLAELPEDANEENLQAESESVSEKLQKIGSVNMVALDEFKEQSERKAFLDAQAEDLTTALNALKNAIATIDREIRIRFKQTFDKVNDSLSVLFPQLFGGGQARLVLVGDDKDVLNADISIMAHPPGKRHTNIHLLSGGEKALTAIALVFAFFELNPAPFCMLDEVDAPLDDTNVGRFCGLVKTISKSVQIIFISHNKITMEMADQLIGVTMQEAGVSRLVAVDIEKAMDMVG
jgi:chromosome segregation protein